MLNEDAPVEVDEDDLGQDSESIEANSDSSSDSEEKHESKSNGVQERINQLTAKRYEEQRRADELQAKLDAIEASKSKPIADAPEVPAYPDDLYDDEKMRKYHADMIAYNQKMALAASKATLLEYQQSAANAGKKTAQQEVVSSYAANAVKDGVDMDKLRLAESALNSAGISDALGSYIMRDKNGGKIAEYLYDNPSVMHEIISLDPVSAGIKIASEIKARALSTTPRVSGAPEPTPEIKGGGMAEKDDFSRRYPGTTFI